MHCFIMEIGSLQKILIIADVRDIANEIYHLIFGETNEILVRSGLVSTPPYYPGEGRYFRSFEQ